MITQQSPYFSFKSWAEDFAWLTLWVMKMLAKIYNYLKYNALVAVIAAAPAKTRSFCQFWEIEFRNNDPKWAESSDKTGIFDMTLLNNLRTGFLSKTVSNILITYFCYVLILDIQIFSF